VALQKRIRWTIVLLFLGLAGLAFPGPLRAQAPHRAALVVDFGDGRVLVRLVEFAEESIRGVDLLERSGLEVALLPGFGTGTALCAIEGVGCPPTPQECFCACRGTPCHYWSYFQWSDGRWLYSPVGAGDRWLRDGDIDGWVWGDGRTPPAIGGWEEILARAGADVPATTAPSPSPTPTPSSAPSPLPSITPALASPVPARTILPATATPSPLPSASASATAAYPFPPPSTTEASGSLRVSPEAWAFGGMLLLLLALWFWVRRRR